MKALSTALILSIGAFTFVSYAQNVVKPMFYFWFEVHVAPENLDNYFEFLEKFKELTEKHNGPQYSIIRTEGKFRWVSVIGGNIGDIDEHTEKWHKWMNTPDVAKLMKEYGYTEEFYLESIWKSLPEYRFKTTQDTNEPNKYRRYYIYNIKNGMQKEFYEAVQRYNALYKKLGIESNMFPIMNYIGYEAPCVILVILCKDMEDYLRRGKLFDEKLKGHEEELKEIRTSFRKTVRSSKRVEGFLLTKYTPGMD